MPFRNPHYYKEVSSVLANDKICIEIKKGEIHTLLGEMVLASRLYEHFIWAISTSRGANIF